MALAINEFVFEEMIYADDLNGFKIVPSSCSVGCAVESIDNIHEELHRCGSANEVTVDAAKESKHVLSRTEPYGLDF